MDNLSNRSAGQAFDIGNQHTFNYSWGLAQVLRGLEMDLIKS